MGVHSAVVASGGGGGYLDLATSSDGPSKAPIPRVEWA